MSAVIALNFLVLLLVSGQAFGQDDAETTTTTPAPIVIKSFLIALLYRKLIFAFQSIKHKVSNSSNNNNSDRHMVVGSVAVECAVVWVDDAAKIEAQNATCSKRLFEAKNTIEKRHSSPFRNYNGHFLYNNTTPLEWYVKTVVSFIFILRWWEILAPFRFHLVESEAFFKASFWRNKCVEKQRLENTV